ncbi:hypothetical protein [Streptomyces sp. NPDC058401]|uniref:hypothetical protein n=1 Tax=Streptomyces sp. NPDC058401 TaxID=3346480 RepID=UPI00364E107F
MFTGADYDTDAMFDATTSTLVVKTPGRYLLRAALNWNFPENAVGGRVLLIIVNGVAVAFDGQDTADVGINGDISQDVSVIIPLKAGDVISVQVSQSSGGTGYSSFLATGPTQHVLPLLQAEWLAP